MLLDCSVLLILYIFLAKFVKPKLRSFVYMLREGIFFITIHRVTLKLKFPKIKFPSQSQSLHAQSALPFSSCFHFPETPCLSLISLRKP